MWITVCVGLSLIAGTLSLSKGTDPYPSDDDQLNGYWSETEDGPLRHALSGKRGHLGDESYPFYSSHSLIEMLRGGRPRTHTPQLSTLDKRPRSLWQGWRPMLHQMHHYIMDGPQKRDWLRSPLLHARGGRGGPFRKNRFGTRLLVSSSSVPVLYKLKGMSFGKRGSVPDVWHARVKRDTSAAEAMLEKKSNPRKNYQNYPVLQLLFHRPFYGNSPLPMPSKS